MIWHSLRILYTWTRWYKNVQSSIYCHAIYHGLPCYGVWRYVLPCTGSMTDSWLCILWTVRIKHVLVCTSLYLYILKKVMSIRVHIGTFWYVLVCTSMYLTMTCENRISWFTSRWSHVPETDLKKDARHKEQVKRAVETRRRRNVDRAWFEWSVFLYQYVPVRTGMYCVSLDFARLEIWYHHMVSLA